MQSIIDFGARIKPALGVDKINLRAPHPLNPRQFAFLKANVVSINPFRSEYYFHHPGHRYSNLVYAIVCPNAAAQQFLDDLPEGTFAINYAEPMLDLIVEERTKWALLHLFDRCFVQPWHKQAVRHFDNGGTVTGQRRFYFSWYADWPSKLTRDPHCFHIEAHCQGRQVLRRIKFEQLRTFDHVEFWRRHLDNLYTVDLESLGRYDMNRITGQRRRNPLLHQSGSFTYNVDQARGAVLYSQRATQYWEDRDWMRSAQSLVDWYGRGRFLRKIDVPSLTHLIVNPHKPFLSSKFPDCSGLDGYHDRQSA